MDLGTIDDSLGGAQALTAFVQAAHKRGIKVVVDVTIMIVSAS